MFPLFELPPAVAITAIFVIVLGAQYLFYEFGTKRHYPPGPHGLPLLGNLLQLSRDVWLPFSRWKAQYGAVVYLNVLGQDVVVLNSLKAVVDLLDRQSAVYSDRPSLGSADVLTGNMFLPIMRHGKRYLKLRRIAQECLSKQASRSLQFHQLKEALLITEALLKSSKSWDAHLRRGAASIIGSATYGLPSLESEDDPEVLRINEFADRLLASVAPMTFISEFLVKYLPTPISRLKKGARYWFEEYTSRFTSLYEESRIRMIQGEQESNLTNVVHDRKNRFGLSESETAWLLAAIFSAGSETTSSVLIWFIFAMVSRPDIQVKAQAELDLVVGKSRLPSFADYDQLHYIRAMVKEVLRWGPVIPLGVPHRSTEDNWYEGYYIPKGTICIGNVWSINRDKELYGEDAEIFNPSRHLDERGHIAPSLPDTKDESHVSYGFGKRICVGRHVANNSIFISIATILWAFNIKPVQDADGHPILPSADEIVNTGLIVRPAYFECSFEPRTPDIESVLADAKELMG